MKLVAMALMRALVGCSGDDGLPYGAACTKADECASGVCGGVHQSGPTTTCGCQVSSDCPKGETCQEILYKGLRCVGSDAGVPPG